MSGSSGPTFATDLRVPSLPPMNRLTAAVNRVHTRWPEAGAPVERNPEAIIAGMDLRERRNDWKNATVAEVLRAARVTYSNDFRTRFKLRRLRRFYVDEVRASRSPGFLGGMMSVYLSTYVPGADHTRALGNALHEARNDVGLRWSGMLENHPGLLDPEGAHERIARRMRGMRDPWTELKATGLRSPHAPGLMDHAHLAYLKTIAGKLRTRDGIDTLMRWLKPGKQAKIGGAPEAIQALLTPWLAGPPPEDLRTHLVDQLVRLYGDPRVRRGPPWSLVGDGYKRLLRQWLTRADIMFFLDVVTAVNVSHMWDERREFWLGLYEQGRIRDAWVAFSTVAERHVRRNGGDDDRELACGRQVGPRPDTSLLILAVGDCIVVEGSHSYKVHFFKSSNPHAPRLFEGEYDCDHIRHRSDESQTHHVRWQSRVLEKLDYLS